MINRNFILLIKSVIDGLLCVNSFNTRLFFRVYKLIVQINFSNKTKRNEKKKEHDKNSR